MCWPGPHSNNCEERGKYCKFKHTSKKQSVTILNTFGFIFIAIQQDENVIERQTSKLQSAIDYALDGDQDYVLTMLSQRCEDPWVNIK